MSAGNFIFYSGQTPSSAFWNTIPTDLAALAAGTAIDPGTITPEKLLAGAGTTWPWRSWTPTWTNLTVSGSAVTAKYIQIGKTVFYRLSVVLGGGNAPTGSVSFTLPVASVSYSGTSTLPKVGDSAYFISGASFSGRTVWVNTTTVTLLITQATTTYAFDAVLSASVPASWTNGNEMHSVGFYEAA